MNAYFDAHRQKVRLCLGGFCPRGVLAMRGFILPAFLTLTDPCTTEVLTLTLTLTDPQGGELSENCHLLAFLTRTDPRRGVLILIDP